MHPTLKINRWTIYIQLKIFFKNFLFLTFVFSFFPFKNKKNLFFNFCIFLFSLFKMKYRSKAFYLQIIFYDAWTKRHRPAIRNLASKWKPTELSKCFIIISIYLHYEFSFLPFVRYWASTNSLLYEIIILMH